MRHRISGKKLGRSRNERKALFKNLISSLIIHGEIKTTEAKVKAIKRLVDKLVTRAKQQNLHSRRLLIAFFQNKKVVNKLVDEIAPKFKNRPGGFTRALRLGKRPGDQAMMVKIEFVGITEDAEGEAPPASVPFGVKKNKEDIKESNDSKGTGVKRR